jgi:hypothetical protein
MPGKTIESVKDCWVCGGLPVLRYWWGKAQEKHYLSAENRLINCRRIRPKIEILKSLSNAIEM